MSQLAMMNVAGKNQTKNEFTYWQCQIRKYSVRNLEAKPTPGICPDLVIDANELGIITTLLVPTQPGDDISHLKHAYQQTYDPKKRRENALKYLQADFYQSPHSFSGELTALAAKGANWIKQVTLAKHIELKFYQEAKHWKVVCESEMLAIDDLRWQFTLAHNQLFNHTLTTNIDVILFKPLWDQVESS